MPEKITKRVVDALAPGTEFTAQDGRQEGEAGDVGEKNGSGSAIGQGTALGERVPAVIGQECG